MVVIEMGDNDENHAAPDQDLWYITTPRNPAVHQDSGAEDNGKFSYFKGEFDGKIVREVIPRKEDAAEFFKNTFNSFIRRQELPLSIRDSAEVKMWYDELVHNGFWMDRSYH